MKRKKFKNTIFIEDCGTYTNEIIVVIGSEFDEVKRYVKRMTGVSKVNMQALEDGKEHFDTCRQKGYPGFLITYKKGFMLMWLKEFTDQWDWFDTLIHECAHATQNVMRWKMIEDDEAFAYLQEHLIKKIRRRVNFIYKLK